MREARTSTGFRVRSGNSSSKIGPVGGFNDQIGNREIRYREESGSRNRRRGKTINIYIGNSARENSETSPGENNSTSKKDKKNKQTNTGENNASTGNGDNNSNSDESNYVPPKKVEPFACRELFESKAFMGEATLMNSFGVANEYLSRITVKLFNTSVAPGRILHGIVYFRVKKSMKIHNMLVKDTGTLTKKIDNKKATNTSTISDEFSVDVVCPSTHSGARNPTNYKALTDNFNGKDVYQRLKLTDDLNEGSEQLMCFRGPINLEPGAHAIPFSIRIPSATSPSVTFNRSNGKLGKIVVQNVHNLTVSMDVESSVGGESATISSGNIPYRVVSCGNLPAVENGLYKPGITQQLDIPYKNSSAIIILEKMHLLTTDIIRIYVYTNKEDAVNSVFAELLQSVNIPEIELTDIDDVYCHDMSASLRMLHRTKKKKMDPKFPVSFTSKIGVRFPPSKTNYKSEDNYQDDEVLMPESTRKAGCMLEIDFKSDGEPTIEIGETRIRYHIRIHFDIKGTRKMVSMAKLITLHEQLLPDYRIENIIFTDAT